MSDQHHQGIPKKKFKDVQLFPSFMPDKTIKSRNQDDCDQIVEVNFRQINSTLIVNLRNVGLFLLVPKKRYFLYLKRILFLYLIGLTL